MLWALAPGKPQLGMINKRNQVSKELPTPTHLSVNISQSKHGRTHTQILPLRILAVLGVFLLSAVAGKKIN